MELELRINGVIESLDVATNETLLSMLRREGHCGVKQGCETGECGACTVLVDGVPRPSCVMLAAQAGGCTLTTIEGLGTANNLHPLQQAFIDTGAVQCGFCSPGMILAASSLLAQNTSPTEDEVRDTLSGNLCRCTGYVKPVQAVMRAAAVIRGEKVAPVEHNVVASTDGNGSATAAKNRALVMSMMGNGVGTITAKIPAIKAGNAPLLDTQFEVVGKPINNIDAVKFVTGQPVFANDVQPRGMLYGRVLASPHAHAIIRKIDVSAAKTLPGVHAVLTYKDVQRVPYSGVEGTSTENGLRDQYILDYIMRYAGDRVAIVAAETPDVAEQALQLIEVDYEVLPAILDPRQALEPNAPQVHPESEAQGIFDATRNIAARVHTDVGDVERGFSESDVVVEGEYIVPAMQQAPLENHNVITYFDEDGYLVVRTSTQAPHHIRRTLAHILNLPIRRIRVIKPAVGGGLGVKQEIVLEDLAALLTIATNRPVMLALTRAEESSSGRLRQQYIVRMKTGVKRDGTIIANQAVLLTSTGAYGTHPLVAQKSATETLALYPCPNMRYVAEVLYTNTPPSGALQGYGAPQEFFALESHMDEIAKRLNMDALQLRRKNWIKAGDEYPWQKALGKNKDLASPIMSCGLHECMRLVEEKLGWRSKRGRVGNGHTRQGVGVALSLYGNHAASNGTSGAIIKLNEDGSFDVFAGVSNSENGASTLLAQIVAESIGVPIETVILHISQTDTAPTDIGENASAALYLSGGAMKKAAEQIRRQLLSVGGRMLNVMPENLKMANGLVTAPGIQSLSMEQIARYSLYTENRHIMTTASWKMPYTPITFAAQGVEIEVDTETGSIRILKAVVAVDAGRVINPQILEGHVQGAVAQGLGSGLVEEVVYDQKGALLTTNLADYHIYSALDMPEVQTYLVESVDPAGPFGAKAVGDVPLHGMAPAIANAIADALGIRMRQAPLTPERILRAVHAQAQAQAQVAKR